MNLVVDPDSVVAPYEQVRQQVTAMVLGGLIPIGTRLPAIRQLANDLGLATGTVARAFRELGADGVVETRGRHGTVIAGPPRHPSPPAALVDAAVPYARQAEREGVSVDDAIVALRVAFARARERPT